MAAISEAFIDRMAKAAAGFGFVGWGEGTDLTSRTPGIGPVFCPGGALASASVGDGYQYDHHDWTAGVECPLDGELVSLLACGVALRSVDGKIQARVVAHVHDLPRGIGFCWLPISGPFGWVPRVDDDDDLWDDFFAECEWVIRGAAEALAAAGVSHAAVWLNRRAGVIVDGTTCPCAECQSIAAHRKAAGGRRGVQHAEKRVHEINRRLRKVQPHLEVDWRAVAEEHPDAPWPPRVTAVATCRDRDWRLLWAVGGEDAGDALDGIEGWAWGMFVADLPAKTETGVGEA